MERQARERVAAVAARTPSVEAAMAAARRALQNKQSDAEVALDTAVERMLADLSDRPQTGAAEGMAVRVKVRAARREPIRHGL